MQEKRLWHRQPSKGLVMSSGAKACSLSLVAAPSCIPHTADAALPFNSADKLTWSC